MWRCSGMSETNNKTELHLAPSPTNQRHRVLEADQSRAEARFLVTTFGHKVVCSSAEPRPTDGSPGQIVVLPGQLDNVCLIERTAHFCRNQNSKQWWPLIGFQNRIRGKWGQQGRIAIERTHTPHTRHRHTEISENNDFWQTRAGPWCSTPQLAATRRFMCRAEPPSILFVLDGTLGGAHSLELINFVINVALMNSQNLLKATNTFFSLKVLLTCIPIFNFNE